MHILSPGTVTPEISLHKNILSVYCVPTANLGVGFIVVNKTGKKKIHALMELVFYKFNL